ncbi:MAG: DUF3465 domain-containing protein [bacterium]
MPPPRRTPRTPARALLALLALAHLLLPVDIGSPLPGTASAAGSASAPAKPHIAPARPAPARRAFEERRSGLWLRARGEVARLLEDDRKGARHQRFILRLPDGLTLLIAHNIDVAPRVPARVGDGLEVYGRYEWSRKGGVIHWTHRDPRGERAGGWIRHLGKSYR